MSNAKISKEREMVTWTPFREVLNQFIDTRKILEDQMKVPRPIVTKDAKDRIEDKLLTSLLSEEEILITYYEDGYVLTNYITVIHINPMKQTVTCTDAFYHISTLKFIDIIDIK